MSDSKQEPQFASRPWFLNKWLLRILAALFAILLVLAVSAWYVYQSAQVVPEYYEALLDQPMEVLDEAGDQFETEILELQNSAIELGEWQAVFTQDQINGWLASDLPQKFPNSLPREITQPRVALNLDELKIIFRYDSPKLTGIVEASGDAFCTEELNQIAVRIKHIRSGVLTLPIASWTKQIGNILIKNGCPTQWTEQDGDTIALIELPLDVSEQEDQKLVIESIEVLDGKVVLQGVTLNPEDLGAYQQSRQSEPSKTITHR